MAAGALIAAAGKYDGMKEFRPMMRLGGTSLIQKEIDTLRQAGISPIVVVTGHEAELLERHLAHRGVVCLRNEHFDGGEMLDSVKLGLSYLQSRCTRVLFLPADAPLFGRDTLEKLLASRAKIAVPVHEGRSGHPILLGGAVLPSILAYGGKRGLRGALESSGAKIERIPVGDPGVLLEIGSSEQYTEALAYEQSRMDKRKLCYRVNLLVGKEEESFGPGLARILSLTDERGSLVSACKEMGISYSKGWKKLRALEENMGFAFLERRPGGAEGGTSRLTEEGRAFLESYQAVQAELEQTAQEAFSRWFCRFAEGEVLKKND